MAKFLSFSIVNSGAPLTEGEVLVNVDQISNISYVDATGVLTLSLSNSATSEIDFLISTDSAGGAGIPDYTSGSPIAFVNRALTANPGGVKASVSLGKDQTGGVPTPGQAPLSTNLQLYANTVTYTA